jgi:hypothetical protein
MKKLKLFFAETAQQVVSAIMHNIISAIYIFILLSFWSKTTSQPLNYSGWFFQNPLPTLNQLNSCWFINENTGFAVGTVRNILKTTNARINWYLNSVPCDVSGLNS